MGGGATSTGGAIGREARRLQPPARERCDVRRGRDLPGSEDARFMEPASRVGHRPVENPLSVKPAGEVEAAFTGEATSLGMSYSLE